MFWLRNKKINFDYTLLSEGVLLPLDLFSNVTGPFGEQDDQQVFVQKVVPETDQLFIRLSSSGKRYCNTLIFWYMYNCA